MRLLQIKDPASEKRLLRIVGGKGVSLSHAGPLLYSLISHESSSVFEYAELDVIILLL